MSLGRYPEISLADARERRDAARKQLAHGVDPMAERMAKKAAAIAATEHSFEKIGEFWLEHWWQQKCPPCRNHPESSQGKRLPGLGQPSNLTD